jgi:cysteine synthase
VVRSRVALIRECSFRETASLSTRVSSGSSLAFVCAVKGYPFKVVSSDAFAREKLQTMRAFGADLTLVASAGGQITPDLIGRMIDCAQEIAATGDAYWTNQLRNAGSIKGYMGIGRELVGQVDGPIHAFCGAVRTAGMLRDAGSAARIVALEPARDCLRGRRSTRRGDNRDLADRSVHLESRRVPTSSSLSERPL